MDSHDSVLVVVDVQGKLASLMFEYEQMFNNIERAIKISQILNVPILWTEQAPQKIGETVEPIRQLLFPALKPIHKREFSCYANAEFKDQIDALGKRQVLLVGMETHVCLYQTARDLQRFGYEVYVVADAVSSRTQANKEAALKRMASEGVTMTSAEMLGCDLMLTADHPKFKDVMANIKR